MSWPQRATPCPASVLSDEFLNTRSDRQNDSFDGSDTTSKIEFTTAFPSFRLEGVKRLATAIRPRRPGIATGFAVHQDEGSNTTEHDSGTSRRHVPPTDKLSILTQPAQRPRSKLDSASGITNLASSQRTTVTGNSAKIRSTTDTDMKAQVAVSKAIEQNSTVGDRKIHKPARRGTVYIPVEDTTMPTVWMGVFSPIKDNSACDTNSFGDRAADLTGIAARMATKRAPRKQSVMEAPPRAPLRRSLRPPQETIISEDIPGRMTGKENLPPGHETTGSKKGQKKKKWGDAAQQPHQAPRGSAFDIRRRPRPSSCGKNNLSFKASSSAQSAQTHGLNKTRTQISGAALAQGIDENFASLCLDEGVKEVVLISRSNEALTTTPQQSAYRNEKLPTKVMIPNVAGPTLDQSYPVLSDDIQNPSLYENSWLAHQEIAITQLINSLFDASAGSTDTGDVLMIRSQILTIYQDQSFVLLQKRLQASLLYGALALPKETLSQSSRLPDDLAMKHHFLDLWLKTYDLQTLQACVEVVVGRECCGSSKTSAPLRLSHYLELFLIRHKDVTPTKIMNDLSTNGIQRTLLRSLMLIKLLDTVKNSRLRPFIGCLFQPSSPYKSSMAVIQALAQMLHPAAGNIVRSLSHLEYHVSYVQYPLEEYDYRINNLAIELRDGVRLTRLVEQLLYPSSSRLLSCAKDEDATTIVTMPTGEVLSLVQGEQDWPLSQYLKFPCLSRATKMYNVQVALSALSGVEGIGGLVDDIKAEHITDGYREKTVVLLWGLTSKWGLGSLIDWVDLKHEIRRLGCRLKDDDDEDEDDHAKQGSLLKGWASAAAMRKGLKVNNLTTSFAEGTVFEAIVDEYEPYLHAPKSNSSSLKAKRYLSQRLADLGCSAQFGKHKRESQAVYLQLS